MRIPESLSDPSPASGVRNRGMPVRTTRFTGGRCLFSAGSQSPEPGGLATRLSSGYGHENTAQSTTRHLPRVLRDAHGMVIMSGAASQAFRVITCCLLHRVRQCSVLPMARFAIPDGAAGDQRRLTKQPGRRRQR